MIIKITPKISVGKIQLGKTRQEVITSIGKPDYFDEYTNQDSYKDLGIVLYYSKDNKLAQIVFLKLMENEFHLFDKKLDTGSSRNLFFSLKKMDENLKQFDVETMVLSKSLGIMIEIDNEEEEVESIFDNDYAINSIAFFTDGWYI